MLSMLSSVLNFRIHEEPRYDLVETHGPFELRHYQDMLCAGILVQGRLESVRDLAHNELEKYLEGYNFQAERLIETGRFLRRMEQGWWFGLIFPTYLNFSDIPKPINHQIQIINISPQKNAVLNFRGEASDELFNRKSEELKRWMLYKGLSYKPHWKIFRTVEWDLPFIRNHEVHFEVK